MQTHNIPSLYLNSRGKIAHKQIRLRSQWGRAAARKTTARGQQLRHGDRQSGAQGGGVKPIYDFLTIGKIIVKYEIILYPACAVMQQTTEPVRK